MKEVLVLGVLYDLKLAGSGVVGSVRVQVVLVALQVVVMVARKTFVLEATWAFVGEAMEL